jgi:hypothetical protein
MLKCVHCLKELQDDVSWDHVFPLSWYSSDTPKDLEKWKVPSCVSCNKRLGKIEDDLRIRLALGLNPNHSATQKLVAAAVRAINPKPDLDSREVAIRQGKQRKILRSFPGVSKEHRKRATLPGFEMTSTDSQNVQGISVFVPADDLQAFAEKVVRGATYYLDNLLLDKSVEIDSWVIAPSAATEADDVLNRFGTHHEIGPSFSFCRVKAVDNEKSSFWKILIWQKLVIYACVVKKYEYEQISYGAFRWEQRGSTWVA